MPKDESKDEPRRDDHRHAATRAIRGADVAREQRARLIAALAAAGAVSMVLIALKQLGTIRHLPDPPIAGFDADRVTAHPEALLFGFPDAPLEAASLAATVPLALWGGHEGGHRPWLPVLVASKAGAEAAITGWYVERMRSHVHAWCAYCLLGVALNAEALAAALPDGVRGARAAPTIQLGAVAGVVAVGVLAWRLGRGSDAPAGRALHGADSSLEVARAA